MESNQTLVKSSSNAFANPTGPWNYKGSFTIELSDNAPPRIIPTPVALDHRKIVIIEGKLRSALDRFLLWSKESMYPYRFVNRIYVKCIRDDSGVIVWKNRIHFES